MARSYEPTCRQLDLDSWPSDKPLGNLRFGSDVNRGVVRWLWPHRLPLARISLLVGDPGVGKSLLLADIAARHSAGLPWPCATVRSEDFARERAQPQETARREILAENSASPRNSHPNSAAPAPSARSHVPTFPRSTPRGGVLFISPEDGVSATLQPRLVAAGADLGNILMIDGGTSVRNCGPLDSPFRFCVPPAAGVGETARQAALAI